MEFNANKDEFIRVLQRMQGIVEKRNTMPILSNVCMEAKDNNNITMSATDLEIYIKDTARAEVKKKGSVTVNARKLFEMIRDLQEDNFNVSVGENEKVNIKGKRARCNIMGLSTKEFPPFPSTEEDKGAKINPEALKEMIDKTAFSVSTDETRYNINGFYFEREDKTARMVTTDGHRLAMIEKKGEEIPTDKVGVILPKKGVIEMRKLLDDAEGEAYLAISKKSATLRKDKTTINIRLIEGEFPNYKQVLPKDNDKKVIAGRVNLLESLKWVSNLSSDKIRGVRFGLSKNKLVLFSSSPDIGDAEEEVEVEYKGSDMEAAFNARYFIDALESFENEKVVLELKDGLSPGILKPEGSEGCLYIIMPMRL